jgi:O-antigen/teichoic acid export membrane protein
MKAYLACLFSFLVIRIDLLMVQHLRGASPTGHYSVAVTLADLLYLLPVAIGTILFPRLAAMGSSAERWRLTARTATGVALVMTAVAAVAALLAHPMVLLLFGADFLPAVPAFRVLAAAVIFLGVNTVLSNHLAATGLPWFAVCAWAAATLLNIGLNVVLIHAHGIVGAAWASLACYAAVLAAQMTYALRGKPVPPTGAGPDSPTPAS